MGQLRETLLYGRQFSIFILIVLVVVIIFDITVEDVLWHHVEVFLGRHRHLGRVLLPLLVLFIQSGRCRVRSFTAVCLRSHLSGFRKTATALFLTRLFACPRAISLLQLRIFGFGQ